jgi:hypothetical protein
MLMLSEEALLGGGSEEEQGNAVVVCLSTWLFVFVVKSACAGMWKRGDELWLVSGLKRDKID